MARPFGGRFSPAAPEVTPEAEAARLALAEARRVDAAGARANLMFAPPVVAALFGLFGGPAALLLSLGAAATLALGAWLLREGLRAEAAFEARPAARRPALPRKSLAALLTLGGTALAALSGGTDLLGSLLYGVSAGGLHLAAFGLDPLRDKRFPGLDAFQRDRVARVAAEAEGYLAATRDAVAGLRDRALDAQVAGFEALARRMIRTVEEDPRDLGSVRKWLTVYLMGARDAAAKFADLYARTRDPRARADFEALLVDLQRNFAQRTERMLAGGREDMDLEITVLRDRLRREGVAAGEDRDER
jgi:hypothetical protein